MSDNFIAAGGWCALNDEIYDLVADAPDYAIIATPVRRGGLSFGRVGFADPLPPSRPVKPIAEYEPLPPAPVGAPPGHWEFGVQSADPENDEIIWGDGGFYGPFDPYLSDEDARESWAYDEGSTIVRRWQPDPLPYEIHEAPL